MSSALAVESASLPTSRDQIPWTGRKWLDAYRENLYTDPLEAATKCGFRHPKRQARTYSERYRLIIDRERDSLWTAGRMSPAQCQYILAGVAAGTLPATPQQVKALELIARIHGLLTDKVDVHTPPGRVLGNLTLVLSQPQQAQLPATVDAQVVTPSHTE